MKLFHETTIKFYSKTSSPKICILSDIHFSSQVKDKRLNSITEKIRERNPDYIFIPGDLVDSNDMIAKASEENRLLNWLKSLGEITTVIISKGNHDFYKKPDKKLRFKDDWDICSNSAFVKKVNQLENVHYLDNESYEDKEIYVFGFTLKPEYYSFFDLKRRVTIFHPTNENLNEFLKELDDIDQKLITNLPKDKLKFILVHSPVYLNEYRVQAELEEFDFFVSGHMHNGIVPPVIDELWRSSTGFVSPTHNMLPRNIRTTSKTINNKMVIAGAVTTWHECGGLLHNFNAFYPTYFMTLEFTKSSRYARKPDITKKYLNF